MDDCCTGSLSSSDNHHLDMHHLFNVSHQGFNTVFSFIGNCTLLYRCCCKGRNSKTDSELELSDVPCITPSAYSTPSSNGRSLKDELMDVEESVDFADQTDKAVFQNTAYCKLSSLKAFAFFYLLYL